MSAEQQDIKKDQQQEGTDSQDSAEEKELTEVHESLEKIENIMIAENKRRIESN